MQDAVEQVPSQQLADAVAALVRATLLERLQVLDAIDVASRIRVTLPLLLRHIQRLKVCSHLFHPMNVNKPGMLGAVLPISPK